MLSSLVTILHILTAQLTGAALPVGATVSGVAAVPQVQESLQLPPLALLPQLTQQGDAANLQLTARAAVVYDVGTDKVLYHKSATAPVKMASITKLMTALVALDLEPDLNKMVTVPDGVQYIAPSVMGLRRGEKVTVREIMAGMLIKSGNDAATVLAWDAGGGSLSNFVERMNLKAKAIGMERTVFANPHGLDMPEAHTTAEDVARMASFAFKNPVVRELGGTRSMTVVSHDNSRTTHYLVNSDKLLAENIGIVAGKTGFTDEAGLCLVVLVERNGHQIISVVLGSEDRAEDSRRLIDWTYNHFNWN